MNREHKPSINELLEGDISPSALTLASSTVSTAQEAFLNGKKQQGYELLGIAKRLTMMALNDIYLLEASKADTPNTQHKPK